MEHQDFDQLTRTVAGGVGTRRQALYALGVILLGGALNGVVTRLGLAEDAAAKAKHQHKAKSKSKRHSQADRKTHGQLQAEGKRKKKRHPKPKPEQGCTEVFCDNGGRCCGGSCVAPGECCPGEKHCGGGCIAETSCCPHTERPCPDGKCVAQDACCVAEQKCSDGSCVLWDDCCPGRKPCGNGFCIPDDSCCPDALPPLCSECEGIVCDNGEYGCQPRSDRKLCPDGSCVTPDTCCPDDPQPQCGQCEGLACEQAQWICKDLTQECPGGEWDPEHCRCKYCEEICDPETHMCHSPRCPEGHQCAEGRCHRVCDSAIHPQLCCLEEFPGQVRCTCRWTNEICFGCRGIATCVPGQNCCPPDCHSVCPQQCREAEICQHCEGAYCP